MKPINYVENILQNYKIKLTFKKTNIWFTGSILTTVINITWVTLRPASGPVYALDQNKNIQTRI